MALQGDDVNNNGHALGMNGSVDQIMTLQSPLVQGEIPEAAVLTCISDGESCLQK